jgi:hypothetical protein
MMQASGEFRRYADEQAAENTVVQRRVQNALRDAAARIDALEKRCLELDAACCDYQRQRDDALQEVTQLRERVGMTECVSAADELERRHAAAALAEQNDRLRFERDIARQEFCRAMAYRDEDEAQKIAQDLGWDCFKDVTP